MDIAEINNLTVTNPNANHKDVSNYKTSDELSYGENNVQYGESTFAKSKRTTKVVTKMTTFLALLIAAIASGSYVFNSFLGADPVIENFDECYHVEDLNFVYTFEITIEHSYLTMEVYDEVAILPDTVEFKESGTYEGSVVLRENSHYTVKFISTNGFDYSSELKKYQITFNTLV